MCKAPVQYRTISPERKPPEVPSSYISDSHRHSIKGSGQNTQQIETDGKKYERHKIIAIATDIADHSSRQSGNETDNTNCNQDAESKKQRKNKSPPRADVPLTINETDNQRDARDMAG